DRRHRSRRGVHQGIPPLLGDGEVQFWLRARAAQPPRRGDRRIARSHSLRARCLPRRQAPRRTRPCFAHLQLRLPGSTRRATRRRCVVTQQQLDLVTRVACPGDYFTIQGKHLYASARYGDTHTLTIFDIEDISAPRLVSTLPCRRQTPSVAVVGDVAFVGEYY